MVGRLFSRFSSLLSISLSLSMMVCCWVACSFLSSLLRNTARKAMAKDKMVGNTSRKSGKFSISTPNFLGMMTRTIHVARERTKIHFLTLSLILQLHRYAIVPLTAMLIIQNTTDMILYFSTLPTLHARGGESGLEGC